MYHVISTLEVSCAIPTLQLIDINDNKIKSGNNLPEEVKIFILCRYLYFSEAISLLDMSRSVTVLFFVSLVPP